MTTWNDVRLPAHEDRLWELYHENSKTSQFFRNDAWKKEELKETLESLHVSLPVQSVWNADLDIDKSAYERSLLEILEFEPGSQGEVSLTFKQLSTILAMSIKFNNTTSSGVPQYFPLEVFGVTSNVVGMPSGVFHFDREQSQVQVTHPIADPGELSTCFPDQEIAETYIFITAIFQRSTVLFGEKGYRFAITESGRLYQNMLISAAAVGVRARLESQYYEREIENLIGVDGVDHALLQVIAC